MLGILKVLKKTPLIHVAEQTLAVASIIEVVLLCWKGVETIVHTQKK